MGRVTVGEYTELARRAAGVVSAAGFIYIAATGGEPIAAIICLFFAAASAAGEAPQ